MSLKPENDTQSNRLSGKVAIITGGGSGIGKASAILLAKEGAKVGILERHKDAAEEVQREIEAFGGTAFAYETDVSDPQSVEAGVANVAAHFGGIDIVFANAGINGVITSIEHMSVTDWSKTVDINLKGTFMTVKYAIPYLKENGGSIIITSSINGNRVFSNFGFSAYSTTKAGQVAFMKMAALELAQFRIRVNAICPGAIQTNIDASTETEPEVESIRIPVVFPNGAQPLEKGPGSAEQVASLVAFLASQDSSHITGTEIYIDGAESLLHG